MTRPMVQSSPRGDRGSKMSSIDGRTRAVPPDRLARSVLDAARVHGLDPLAPGTTVIEVRAPRVPELAPHVVGAGVDGVLSLEVRRSTGAAARRSGRRLTDAQHWRTWAVGEVQPDLGGRLVRRYVRDDGAWPVPDASVDLVYAAGSLAVLRHPRHLLGEVHRKLAPNGIGIFVVDAGEGADGAWRGCLRYGERAWSAVAGRPAAVGNGLAVADWRALCAERFELDDEAVDGRVVFTVRRPTARGRSHAA